jgi:hypothetical protein
MYGVTGANLWRYGSGGGPIDPIYYSNGRVGILTNPSVPANTQYLLDVSGNIKTIGITNVSDYRIKNEIVYMADADADADADQVDRVFLTNQIRRLRPVMFQNRMRNDNWEYGFIAHEIQEIFPELVNGIKDTFGEYQAISYHQLFAICCEELKTLNARIRSLEAKRLHQ